ncbi:MAG: PaaI family thioesterase [Dehalococcoidia bacterium]|jgi:acyl-coenzyme A thioesterase PaaI-like protein
MTNWPKANLDMVKESDLCFACGPKNPIGLKLKFAWDGKEARAEFTPGQYHQGWSKLVHGGIMATLLDEAMSYAALYSGVNSLTARLQTRFRMPLPIDQPLTVIGAVTKQTKRLVETRAELRLKDGTVAAEGTATMFIVNPGKETRLDAGA